MVVKPKTSPEDKVSFLAIIRVLVQHPGESSVQGQVTPGSWVHRNYVPEEATLLRRAELVGGSFDGSEKRSLGAARFWLKSALCICPSRGAHVTMIGMTKPNQRGPVAS
jgi:hypothetical protein